MLKGILNSKSCSKCRICCGFDESDKWEIPLIYSENEDKIEQQFGLKLIKRDNEYVFDMTFNKNEVIFCPALGENGCTLGELKPFDCKIWPFRVNKLGEFNVITVSPVCREVSSLPLDMLCKFVNSNNFAEKLFTEAENHPDIVKPYIDDYPILAVKAKNTVKAINTVK